MSDDTDTREGAHDRAMERDREPSDARPEEASDEAPSERSGSKAADAHNLDLALKLEREGRAHAERELTELRKTRAQFSYRDGLTGLLNHRAFCERLDREIRVAAENGRPLSVLFGDIDHFSALNSELGHAFGDEALVEVAKILAQGEDRGAIAGRYGGEEFAVLLPGTQKDEAAIRANRMRDQIASAAFADGRALTVSFGIAAHPDDGDDLESVIRAAEAALRAAKLSGRNRVHLYRDDGSCPRRDARDSWPTSSSDADDARSVEPRFPTPREQFRTVASALERDRSLSCLYIDLSALGRIEIEHGVPKHAEVLESVGLLLEAARGERLRRDDIICRAEHGDAYVCFLSPSRTRAATLAADLEAVAARVEDLLEQGLADEVHGLIRERPRIPVGFSRVLKNPMLRAEKLIDRLMSEARNAAELHRQRAMQRDKNLVQEIILHDQVGPVYQPIVHLDSAEVFGYESLSRGPAGTSLESPAALFTIADDVNLTFELDRACFRGALRGAVGLEPVHRLFVNLLPLSFYDPSFIESEVSKLLHAAGLTPSHVVFEITERLAIENFSSFRRALASYTEMGFGVAIDDVGTRHSNLESVMALRPHFIKISDILTRGVSRSTVKREMLRSLGRIAQTIDAVVVAEGIETPDDLAVLVDLGVRYGQGFFLGRPGPAFPRLRPEIQRTIRGVCRSGAEPIPAPPADAPPDVDEDEVGHESSLRTIRQAVYARAEESGQLVDADFDALAEVLALRDDPEGEQAPARRSDPNLATARERELAMPLVAGEWKPVSNEELGGSSEEPGRTSLMESLRAGERAASTVVDEESTGGGTAYP